MSTIKHSRQRQTILNCLKNRCDHPTADDIYKSVTQIIPNISLGTVYRNLTFLVQQGDIVKIAGDFGPDHYDAIITPHYHFICNKCGAIRDIDAPLIEQSYLDKISKNFKGKINNCKLTIYGECEDCIKAQG